jgi:hypothetical protein
MSDTTLTTEMFMQPDVEDLSSNRVKLDDATAALRRLISGGANVAG